MAKRNGAVGSGKKRSPHKTKKRLEIKRQFLLALIARTKKHKRHSHALA